MMKSMFIFVKGNQAAVANKAGQVKRFEAASERMAGLAAFNYVLTRVPANSTDVYRIVVKNKSFLKQMKWMNRNIPNYIATGQLRSGEKFTAEEIAMFKAIKQSKLAYKGTKLFVITETELKREEKESWKAFNLAKDAVIELLKKEQVEEQNNDSDKEEKPFVRMAQDVMNKIEMYKKLENNELSLEEKVMIYNNLQSDMEESKRNLELLYKERERLQLQVAIENSDEIDLDTFEFDN